jgi:hypothetical protein
MYCIDQTTTVLLGRSYGPPDLYPIESLWTFNVKKTLNFNFHTMGQKFWGFWTIVYSQMTIDLGELAQYHFLPRYSPDLASFVSYHAEKLEKKLSASSKPAPSGFS